jgi:SAM-dependent methyltransferase
MFSKITRRVVKAARTALTGVQSLMPPLGSQRYCCFCRRRVRQFLPTGIQADVFEQISVVGGGPREEAVCPYCKSYDRERLVFIFLREKTHVLDAKMKVLHIAPEVHIAPYLRAAQGNRYVTGDIEKGVADHQVDIMQMPFSDNDFDAVICNHVLEHVPDDMVALQEIFRVIRPGGWAVLQVPISYDLEKTIEDPTLEDGQERLRRFGQIDHVRLYGKDYVGRLNSVGFDTTAFDWTSSAAFGGSANVNGLCRAERVHYCVKPE